MSMITDASFWNEHATYRRGWKRSTRYSRTDSAVSPSKSGGRSMGGAWSDISRSAPAAKCSGQAALLAMRRSLDRAFPFAAHDLVRLVALPVNEMLHVLEVEFDGQREIPGAVLELLHADARDE